MAHLPNVDTLEEDAADLQFPKDLITENDTSTMLCYTCNAILKEPYIRCAECFCVQVCTSCFASGAECGSHLNSHDYIVIKNEFSLFEDSSWTAREEIELLDAIIEYGLGNWSDIACRVQTHSAGECERHYIDNYVDRCGIPELPIFMSKLILEESAPIPLYDSKQGEMEEPPRYSPHSNGYTSLAGYNAGRSDFEIEYDNHAEEDISDLNIELFDEKDEYQELGKALQVGVVSKYNQRLKERARRKKVVREHGLIVIRKSITWQQRYEQAMTREVVERLIPFSQLMNGMDMDYIMESLNHAGELKQRLLRLFKLRENGLTQFRSCQLYYDLTKERENYMKERRVYLSNPEYCWRAVVEGAASSPTLAPGPSSNPRRPAPPLDIVGLPMYERLSPAERELCSTARIVPESYLVFKNILISEYKQNGSLKLAHARTLIKIDVNKTRKLYDFLLKEGYINKVNHEVFNLSQIIYILLYITSLEYV